MSAIKVKLVSTVSVLVLCSCAFGLMRSAPAQAEDDQGLFIPSVDDSWNNNGWIDREQSGSTPLASVSSDRSTRTTAKTAARRHTAAKKNNPEEKNTEISKESSKTEMICRALPWAAGVLGFAGFAMVIVSLLSRRRRSSQQINRSAATMKNAVGDGWIDRSPTQAVLAFRLARTNLPSPRALPSQQKKEKKRELRRAA